MNKRRWMLVVLAIIALGGAIGGWWFSLPLPVIHPEAVNVTNVVHAAAGIEDGCAKCHTGALPFTNCLDAGCHDAPSTTVGAGNNVYLAHHDVTATDDCILCHEDPANLNDGRYVVVPVTGHNFCNSCHDMFQHGG